MIINNIKTAALLGSLTGLFMLVGGLLGGQSGMVFALITAIAVNFFSYYFSDKIVLSLYKAQPLSQTTHTALYQLVQELAQNMKLPMPKLWIIDTPIANAFATGRNPHHSSIAVTTGILNLLTLDELRGVLAHELSHIKNRDILVGTLAATCAGAIGFLANMLQHMVFWQSRSDRNSRGQNPVVLFIISLLIPLIATLIQLAISRTREYLADETGAHACQDPLALATALEKLHFHTQNIHFNQNNMSHAATAHLFIVNPFSLSKITHLFSTHPPISERIKRLKSMNTRPLN